jgi:hypothetical protein
VLGIQPPRLKSFRNAPSGDPQLQTETWEHGSCHAFIGSGLDSCKGQPAVRGRRPVSAPAVLAAHRLRSCRLPLQRPFQEQLQLKARFAVVGDFVMGKQSGYGYCLQSTNPTYALLVPADTLATQSVRHG